MIELVILIICAALFACLLLMHVFKLLLVSDFQLDQINNSEFIRRYNSTTPYFIVLQIATSFISLFIRYGFFLLCIPIMAINVYEFYLWYNKRLYLELLWAVKSLYKIKVDGLIKLFVLVWGFLTSIIQIILLATK